MEANYNIEHSIADTIIERPHGFKVGGRQFYLYPVTLGKSYLLSRLMEGLDINKSILEKNPYMETLRLSHTKKDEVIRIITYHTLKGKSVFDHKKVESTIKHLADNLTEEEIAQIFILLLSNDNISAFQKHLKIDKEKEAQAKVMKCKEENKNTYSFGGKSIYGTLIDFFAQRYGWTMDYILWGISYNNLQMLMSDAVTTVHLTDNERKRCRVSNERNYISGDNPENMARIRSMFGD